MYYVYILRSKKNGKLYAGYSADLKRRMAQHISGDVHTTKRMGSIELIFYEAFKEKSDAKRREIYLKTTKGKRAIKLMLKNTLALSSSG